MPIGGKRGAEGHRKEGDWKRGLRIVMKVKDNLYGKWTREPPPDE